MFGSFFMSGETKAVNDFSISVARKDIGNIKKLVKKYNGLLELRNEQNMPYAFIVLEFMDTIQFINLIQDISIDISKITNMHNDNIILYAFLSKKEHIAYHFIENLTKYNLNINHTNNKGYTALHSAVFGNQIEIIKVLLMQPTININQQDNNGWTSLHIAIYFRFKDIFYFLLNNQNININLQNNIGETPLHFAVYDNYIYSAKLLLESDNVDINVVNGENKTAYHYAVKNKSYEIANLIKQKEENDVQIKKLIMIKPPVGIKDNTDLNSIQIENSIKIQEKEIRALKIKLKIKKREEQLQEIWTIQRNKQVEMENIEFELQTLSNNMAKKEKEIAEIKEAIKAKEDIYDDLINTNIDTSEKENEIAKLKESLNHIIDLPDENVDNECPICFHLMHKKKIYQCSQGHYYCETCKANIQICPYCREDISKIEIRNRYIEQLLAKLNINE